MSTFKKSQIKAFVPRSLILNGKDALGAHVTEDGLCPLCITWEEGKIKLIEPICKKSELPLKLLLPRFVETHAHIDKAFTWNDFPNLLGTYNCALQQNLKEHKNRNIQDISQRTSKALEMALRNGIRTIRTHVDSFGLVGIQSWDKLIDIRSSWRDLIDLQLVALVPIEYWGTSEGLFLASHVANSGGLLGGVLQPPFNNRVAFQSLFNLIKTANNIGCGVDLHIDETQNEPAIGLNLLLKVLEKISNNVPITCSHSSSMGLLPKNNIRSLAEKLFVHKINVIALPLTNAWLLGRNGMDTPVMRPLAPIYQLQKAGVTVAVGSDNVKDPWFPLGNFDPISLIALCMPLAQLAPWQRLGLSPFTTSAAKVLDLKWDGTFFKGSPANWILIDAKNWVDALSLNAKREVIVNGIPLLELPANYSSN